MHPMENDQILLERAVALHQAGKLADAEIICHALLQRHPQQAQVLHFLGILASERQKPEQAMAMIQAAIRIDPHRAEFHSNLSTILNERGRSNEALNSARQAIYLEPNFAEAYNNAGNALHQMGDFLKATEAYRQAIAISPDYAMFYCNLGNNLRSQGDVSAAITSYEQCLRLKQDSPEAYNNLGIAWMDLGFHNRAAQAFSRAIQLSPTNAEAYKNLGNAWVELGMYTEAAEAYKKANEIKVGSASAELILAKQHACDWNGLLVLAQDVAAHIASPDFEQSVPMVVPFAFLTLPVATSAASQQRSAQAWSRRKFKMIQPLGDYPRVNRSDEKLRVGYLSSDFYAHATSHLIAELFEQHRRDRFEVFGYSIGRTDQSPVAQRIQRGCNAFIDLSAMTHLEAAKRIQNDDLQILVDLKGYTRGSRPEILAHRPAPIQVSYLGYPGTMGVKFIDYIVVDDWVVPPNDQSHFTEQRVALPVCYQVNDSQIEIASDYLNRSQYGLPENAFVFNSWCNPYKITPTMFDVWTRFLREIPDSVLWLIDSNPTTTQNLKYEASLRGVDPSRLIFSRPQPSPIHLARHRLADLVLDTFPVGAHTTASDALRLGVPMVTLKGETFVSRVASSLLLELGLPELVANSLGEYETIVLTLSKQRSSLQNLRERLNQTVGEHPLFSAKRITRHMEHAFELMWARYLRGEVPKPILSKEFPK
jgi:protein O-GlcNAc transferase